MKKILAILISVLLIMSVLSGCGNTAQKGTDDQKSEASTVETQTQEQTEKSVYPLTVKDANGFEMKIDKEAQSIVSLTLGSDEMLLGLVDKARIKALTNYSDDVGISNVADAAKEIAGRADSEAEKVIAMGPDLVFTDTWAKPEFVQQLRDAGITVYVFKTPSNYEEQKSTIQDIAHVVGADDNGKEIVAWMDGKLKDVEDKLKALKPEEKLTVLDYSEMSYASGKGTNFDDIVTRAGLINAASQAGMESWVQISKEMIVELNPDVLILPSWFYDKKNTLESFTKGIKDDKSLTDVKAVKNDKILALSNPHMSAISQYVVLGIEDTAKAAYPELFK